MCLFGGQERQDLDPGRQGASRGRPQQRGRRAHLSQSRLWTCPWAALPVQSEPRLFPGPWPCTAGLPPPHPLQLGLSRAPFPKGAHSVRQAAETTQPMDELPIGIGGTQEPPSQGHVPHLGGAPGVCTPRSLQDTALPSAEDGVSHRP